MKTDLPDISPIVGHKLIVAGGKLWSVGGTFQNFDGIPLVEFDLNGNFIETHWVSPGSPYHNATFQNHSVTFDGTSIVIITGSVSSGNSAALAIDIVTKALTVLSADIGMKHDRGLTVYSASTNSFHLIGGYDTATYSNKNSHYEWDVSNTLTARASLPNIGDLGSYSVEGTKTKIILQ